MAQESCNLDKDEAEILKPSSSSSPPPPPPTTPCQETQSPPPPPLPSSPPQPPATTTSFILKPCEEIPAKDPQKPAIAVSEAAPAPPAFFGNRCNVCQRKVGLPGFRCRCGDLFCPRHRHSETHDCSFDYKAAGREEIARANPVIRAAKIIKI